MIKDIIAQTSKIPRALLLLPLLLCTFLFFTENKGSSKEKIRRIFRSRWLVLFFFYCSFLMMTTIIARVKIKPYNNILGHLMFSEDPYWNNQILENTLLFIPYSFLFLCAFKTKGAIKNAIVLTCCTTVFIEVFQLLFWLGEFQLSDIVHNILGGIIGCGLWIFVNAPKIKNAFSRVWKWIGRTVRR